MLSIRTQALIVFAASASWYLAIWFGLRSVRSVSSLTLPWLLVLFLGPIVTATFAFITAGSHLRPAVTNRAWAFAAIAAAVVQFLVFYMVISDEGFGL
jgi:hypothetical protein